MIGLLCFVVAVLASPFKSKIRLEAENATLRHQLVALRRKLKGRARLTNNDRWFLRPDVSMFSVDLEGRNDCPAWDAGELAPGRLSSLLALEIAAARRAPANPSGPAHADPANERREPALGVATHSRQLLKLGFAVAQASSNTW